MPPAALFEALLAVAARLSVDVRQQAVDGKHAFRGGLCVLHARPTVLLDAGAPLLERIGVLAEALRTFDVDGIAMLPAVRARISCRPRILPPPRPLAQAAPKRPPTTPKSASEPTCTRLEKPRT